MVLFGCNCDHFNRYETWCDMNLIQHDTTILQYDTSILQHDTILQNDIVMLQHDTVTLQKYYPSCTTLAFCIQGPWNQPLQHELKTETMGHIC